MHKFKVGDRVWYELYSPNKKNKIAGIAIIIEIDNMSINSINTNGYYIRFEKNSSSAGFFVKENDVRLIQEPNDIMKEIVDET